MKSVLVVDDSRIARSMMKKSLPAGCEWDITEAGNGQEALDVFRSKTFDVIFLDLTMPVMDGYAFLEEFSIMGSETPVFVVSADIQQKAKERVGQYGVKAFINKGSKTDELKTQVENVLRENQII